LEFNPLGSAGGLALGIGTTEQIRMSSAGNIGIGKGPDASYKVDVTGKLRTSDTIFAYQSAVVYQSLIPSAGYYMSLNYESTNPFSMGGATFSLKTYDSNNLQTSVFIGAGKVGIGNGASNVSATLGVQGSISAQSLTLTGTGQSLSLTFPGWISVTFTNSWTNFDTTSFNAAGYTIDAYGRVTLRGLIRSGTINSPAFTLQAGYRPPKMVMFPCATSSNSTSVLGELRIGTDGAVTVVSGGNGYVSLEGMNFNINA
jgi:hypothetical protein